METLPADLPVPVRVEVDGVDVATWVLAPESSGSGDVVFCHGTPWSAEVWAAVARDVARGYRVHLWDMPGYGRSSMNPAVPIDLPAQMTRLAHLLAHWGLERPHVVAHDIGGAVALGAHLLRGSEFGSLYLWDVVTLDPWGSPFFRLVADHADVFAALPAALHGALVREYVAGAANHRLSASWLDRLTDPWTGDGQAAFYRQIAALRPEHTRPVVERLGQVRCRSAVGWGQQDPWIPVDQAGRLAELLPGDLGATTLRGVGHLAPIEAAGAVARSLEAWLVE